MIGRRDGIPDRVLDQVDKTIKMCQRNDGTRLCLAINYGGRAEIVDAVRQIAEEARRGDVLAAVGLLPPDAASGELPPGDLNPRS